MIVILLISNVVLWALALLLSLILLGVLRGQALSNWRIDQLEAITPSRAGRSGLRIGRKAPSFTLPSAQGARISFDSSSRQKRLLVFMHPGCGPCRTIRPELERVHRAGEVGVVVALHGGLEVARNWAGEAEATYPIAVEDGSLSRKYEVVAAPFAFLVDERGIVIAKGLIKDGTQLGFVLAGHRSALGIPTPEDGAIWLNKHLVEQHQLPADAVEVLDSKELIAKHEEVHSTNE